MSERPHGHNDQNTKVYTSQKIQRALLCTLSTAISLLSIWGLVDKSLRQSGGQIMGTLGIITAYILLKTLQDHRNT